jgi:hypothetical protein
LKCITLSSVLDYYAPRLFTIFTMIKLVLSFVNILLYSIPDKNFVIEGRKKVREADLGRLGFFTSMVLLGKVMM